MSLESNNIYALLKDNKWDELLRIEKEFRNEIVKDSKLLHLFNIYLIPQLIEHSKKQEKHYSHIILKKLYLHFLHIYKSIYSIDTKIFESLVEAYIDISIKVQKEKEAYIIAKKWDYLDISKVFINEYHNKNLKEVKHNQDDSIELRVNNPTNSKLQIPLFKSKQEIEFYYALRDYYPNHLIYPNVSLSCIIDYNNIKNNLTDEELDYFLKAIVDCVIFKQEDNNFYPEICFELDSIFHDEEKQLKKDNLKNQILTKSGHTIYRIRCKENNSPNREELKKLIKEKVST